METFKFTLEAVWEGGRMGQGRLDTKGISLEVSLPAELNGPGIGGNPDELLLAAAANCYMITLAAILEKREPGIAEFKLNSQATVELDGGRLSFKKIVHQPRITLSGADEQKKLNVEQLTHRAEKACMVSQALRGNVEIVVEPEVVLA
jgi:peroxiredoxin-like protein